MSQTTPNLGLVLRNSSELTTDVAVWIDENTGYSGSEESNLEKIDNKFGEVATGLSDKSELVRGYYYGAAFYEDSAHEVPITPNSEAVYYEKNEEALYLWSAEDSAYIPVSVSDSDFGTWG